MFKYYIVNGREYFVSDEIKKDFPFPESLLRFLYLDITQFGSMTNKLAKWLEEYYPTRDKTLQHDVLNGIQSMAEQHIYFQFLFEEWEQRFQKADAWKPEDGVLLSDLLPRKELSWIVSEADMIQKQIKGIFAAVLDKENSQCTLEDFYREKSNSLYHFAFAPLTTKFEMTETGVFAEVLYPNSFYDLIDYALRECFRQNVKMRVCKNCGRYFALSGKGHAEYCDITLDDKGRTCKEIGAMKTYSIRKKDNVIFSEYRREYKRRFSWIKAGRIDAAAFYAWSAAAKEKEAECEAGTISFEEFKAWLAR